jgi:hypothetical protein
LLHDCRNKDRRQGLRSRKEGKIVSIFHETKPSPLRNVSRCFDSFQARTNVTGKPSVRKEFLLEK